MSLSDVAREFGLCNPTVGKILKNTAKYTKARIFNPDMNERYFQYIDCEDKAYFLGLLISDGNVFDSQDGRQAAISITLDSKDEYLLQKFKDVTKCTTTVAHDGRGCAQIALRSNLMAEDLARYGVIPKKSFCTFLPIIPNIYIWHI